MIKMIISFRLLRVLLALSTILSTGLLFPPRFSWRQSTSLSLASWRGSVVFQGRKRPSLLLSIGHSRLRNVESWHTGAPSQIELITSTCTIAYIEPVKNLPRVSAPRPLLAGHASAKTLTLTLKMTEDDDTAENRDGDGRITSFYIYFFLKFELRKS